MAGPVIAILIVALIACASIWAARRFREFDRLPMQWWFDGRVTWSAPRHIALAFTPTLASLVLGGASVAFLAGVSPRPGQEHLATPALVLLGGMFLAIHAFHLWMIERTVR